jgi:hypothetical protein
MSKWSDWFSVGGGDTMTEKVTVNENGSTKYESLRSIDGSKENHQHVYINRDQNGDYTQDKNGVVGGSTAGKTK